MPKLSPVNGNKLIKTLGKIGFIQTRQEGSHVRIIHSDGRRTTVPVHSGQNVQPGLLRKILRDCKITPEEYNKLR